MTRTRPGPCEHEQTGDEQHRDEQHRDEQHRDEQHRDEQHRIEHLEADHRRDELTSAIAWLVEHGKQTPRPPAKAPLEPPIE